MEPLTAARSQMELSLGFHMIFAALGVAMPVLLVIAEGLWLRTNRPHYLQLARAWGKVTGVLFAIGAVSGTALSFELGLLWPRFMAFAGSVIGPAFALEGYAFFLEAIFIGLYLYGWERLSPRAHWWCGIAVAVSGTCSGILVLGANAFMQSPTGFTVEAGRAVPVDVLAPFATGAFRAMALHNTVACLCASAFAVAGVYAYGLLHGRDDARHRSGMTIAMVIAATTAVLQLVTGDVSAREVAASQPAKLAAMEAHFETGAHVPLLVGGAVDADHARIHGALALPDGLSLLLDGRPDGVVPGLDRIPRGDWPAVGLVHLAFDVMVGAGMTLIAVGLLYWLARWRRRDRSRALSWSIVLVSPLGFLALEAGWVVAEAGRQPWVAYGVMRTRDAVTSDPGVVGTLAIFTALYLFLAIVLIVVLRRLARATHAEEAKVDSEAPHGR